MEPLRDLNFLDWVILAIVLVSLLGSFLKGFAREAISLGSVVVGIVLASQFYSKTAGIFLPVAGSQDLAALLGFVTIFAGCLVAGALVSSLARKFMGLAQLRWFDRLLGAAFGLIRGWMIAAVLVLALTAFPVKLASIGEARLAPFLLVSARALVQVTPQSLKDRFMEGYGEVERLLREQPEPPSEEETSARVSPPLPGQGPGQPGVRRQGAVGAAGGGAAGFRGDSAAWRTKLMGIRS